MVKRRRGTTKPNSDNASKLRIRMYNVGFGDCFLVFIPVAGGTKKIVLDCGTLKGNGPNIRQISDQLIEDCRDPDGVSRVDVLIMTHRHADHISGFMNPNWSNVEVREVWMPWIESRDNLSARAYRETQLRAVAALELAVKQLHLDPELAQVALNARSNNDALDVLHGGFALKVKPQFFPAGDQVVEKIDSASLPGVDIFVLGPPRNERALKAATPPKDQSLLTGFVEGEDAQTDSEKFQPLSRDWIDESLMAPFDQADIQEAVSQQSLYELLAAKVDAEINNTSLILIFRVGDDYLLFPGDAQWGPWELVLANDEALDLLRKVTFLKVGHHASHNASPTTLIRKYLGQKNKRNNIVHAMISMTPYSKWKHIPHKPLIDELKARGFPFVISDEMDDSAGFSRNEDLWFELTLD